MTTTNDEGTRNMSEKGTRGGGRRRVPQTLSVAEQEELELGEAARQSSGPDWSGAVAPGRASDFGGNFGRLLGLLKPYSLVLVLSSLCAAAAVALQVIAPRVLGDATNIVFQGAVSKFIPAALGTTKEAVVQALNAAGQGDLAKVIGGLSSFTPGQGIDFDALSRTLLTVIALYVVASLLGWVQGYVINIIMVRAMFRLREQVEAKIHRLPLRYYDKVQRGELISRVTNDIDNITQTMQQSLSQAAPSILTVVGVLIMMFSVSWLLALIALGTLPLMGLIFGVIMPRSQKAFQRQWSKVGRLNARVEESFSGHALMKVYGREQSALAGFQAENEELYQAAFRAQFLSSIMMPAMQFVGNLVYVALAVVGAALVAGGSLRIGAVQAFIQYAQQFSQPLGQLGQMSAMLQSGVASAERVFGLLDEDEELHEAEDGPALATGDGTIEFEHVRFSYVADRELIRDLSFTVRPGQTVAIVGPTGAGKTTIVNLVMRFYDLDGGRILVNGQDIATVTRHDLRAKTGMVLQDPWLFAGTIRENIRYGRQSATDEEVLAAAQATYVDRFVHSLPEGYDTKLDEDAANISAGQRQLITIARAFVAQPNILILDEATSSVDTRTELHVQRAMAALRDGRTSFVIAHRLSTIRDADLILVMEHGDIVEQGSHDELIATEGAYFRLYNAQFEQAADVGETVDAAPTTGSVAATPAFS